jgi:hypothetical protein
LVVRPAKGVRSRWCFGTGGVGAGVGGRGAGSLGHIQWSRRQSHPRAIRTNWEKKRAGTMAKPFLQVEK